MLDACGRAVLEEAFFIEKTGIACAAKMALLAESTEERMLYGLIGAEEVTHLAGVAAFMHGERPAGADAPFLALLSEVVATGDRHSLQLVIQVVLEGWGLEHYRRLRLACVSPQLVELLVRILADEARHHGSGVVLCGEAMLPDDSAAYVLDIMRRFLQLVRLGPQGVVAGVEGVLGSLDSRHRLQLLIELEAERQVAARLALLRKLLGKVPSARALVTALEDDGAFRPCAVEECL